MNDRGPQFPVAHQDLFVNCLKIVYAPLIGTFNNLGDRSRGVPAAAAVAADRGVLVRRAERPVGGAGLPGNHVLGQARNHGQEAASTSGE